MDVQPKVTGSGRAGCPWSGRWQPCSRNGRRVEHAHGKETAAWRRLDPLEALPWPYIASRMPSLEYHEVSQVVFAVTLFFLFFALVLSTA